MHATGHLTPFARQSFDDLLAELNKPLKARLVLSDPDTGRDYLYLPVEDLVEVGDTVEIKRGPVEFG